MVQKILDKILGKFLRRNLTSFIIRYRFISSYKLVLALDKNQMTKSLLLSQMIIK
jgi:hypothetical protein